MWRLLLACLALVLEPVLAAEAAPEPAAAKGLAIAQAADAADQGWQDMQADLSMVLRNAAGEQSRRELRIRLREIKDDGDQSLITFQLPRDIAGTALLSYSHALTPDEQWLYLPALKRVKRIASANKSGPFVGSEFAYEDLTSMEAEKYAYRWLRDEDLAGRPAHVLEETPRYEHSGYARRLVWLDRERLQPLKVEFHDRKDALLKTLAFEDYQQYLGRYWRAARMTMVNHQSGKSTELTWRGYAFGNGYTARDFDQNSVARER